MIRSSRWRIAHSAILIAALTSAFIVGTGASAANAAPTGTPVDSAAMAAPVKTVATATTGNGQPVSSAVADYWTPQRIASAVPVPAISTTGRVDSGLVAARSSTVTGSGSADPQPPTVHSNSPSGVNPSPLGFVQSRTVGILYFTDAAGTNRYCTAAVINHPTQDVITTSGQCVYGVGGNGWHSNFTFRPQFYQGSATLGVFYASYIETTTAWVQNRDLSYNYAFLRLSPRSDGQKVAAVTGSNGYYYGGTQSYPTVVWGYENDGIPYWCQATSYAYVFNALNAIQCSLGAGNFGGPWLAGYDGASGLGWIFSVSGGASSGSALLGSYQDQNWYNIFISF